MTHYIIYENKKNNYFKAFEVVDGLRISYENVIYMKFVTENERKLGLMPFPTRASVEASITEDGNTFEWGN